MSSEYKSISFITMEGKTEMETASKHKLIKDILCWGFPLSFAPVLLTSLVFYYFIRNAILALMFSCVITFSLFFLFELFLIFDRLQRLEKRLNKTREEFDVILYAAKGCVFFVYGLLSAVKIFTKLDEPLSASIYAFGILVSFDRIISCIKEIRKAYLSAAAK